MSDGPTWPPHQPAAGAAALREFLPNVARTGVAQKLGMTLSAHVHNPHMQRDVKVWPVHA
jgi:hypothetical protein